VRFYTSYIGTIFHFFPYVRVSPTICPREIFGKVLISCSRDIWGQSVHPSKISSRHNARPEVDINKRSTAFFTVRRPLGDGINNCRQGALQMCETQEVPRPKNFQTPISRELLNEYSRNFLYTYRPYPLTIKEVTRKLNSGKNLIPRSEFSVFGGLGPNPSFGGHYAPTENRTQ